MNVQLPSLGVNQQFITFTHVTMESEKYICVRETAPQNSVVIIDMSMPMQPLRRPITADSALMNPNNRILALKGTLTSFWCVRAINITLLLIIDVPERNVYFENTISKLWIVTKFLVSTTIFSYALFSRHVSIAVYRCTNDAPYK